MLFLAALILVLASFFLASLFLHVQEYTIQARVLAPMRIVHLSDLHNAQFGDHNRTLVEAVKRQRPDLIVMSGDMLNRDEENTGIVTSLIADLTDIAPVFYGYGNHEKGWELRFKQDLRPVLEAAGAAVVDNNYVDLELAGTEVRIGGYMGFYPVSKMTTLDPAQQEADLSFVQDFENTERLKLLINHIPTGMIDWRYADDNLVDLVFSGHYHGGVMRIPILDQGLYAPYVGWFPPFTKGVFTGKQATCVLSAGLGNEYHIPRLNNPPEIVVVDLVPICR